MTTEEIAQLKAREEMHWRTLRECADILCLPDESPSLLPEKIRQLQACLLSEKRAKVERGEMLAEMEEIAKDLLSKIEAVNSTVDDEIHLSWPVLSPMQIAEYRAKIAKVLQP